MDTEEQSGGIVDEFSVVISLKRLWYDAKLSVSICSKINNTAVHVRIVV